MAWTRQELRDSIQQRLGDGLFIVVSNREPYIHRLEGERVAWQVPPSGLTVALDPVMQTCGGTWVAHGSGDADRRVVDAHDRIRVPPDAPAYTLRRVWLTEEEEAGYYYGFSNRALWPLCHIAYTRPIFDETDWDAYRAVNRKFADVVMEEVGDRNAFIFIQDYHFALLPRLLRRPNIRTAHFWHIPWPNPEVFDVCPWAEEILDGLLGNDLLGFHIRYHCQNFMDTVNRMIEAKTDYERFEVTRGSTTTLVRPFPISVDFDDISAHAEGPNVVAEMERLMRSHRLEDQIVGLGVDRIDYTKGIPERLRALDRFFERHPDFVGRVVFVEVGVPSRVQIEQYKWINQEIDQLVADLNQKYGRPGWQPVLYIKEHISPEALRAWYRLAHFCLVSSLHDGMNLVAKEYIASRVDGDGVLIVSRFAGASRELSEAIPINPYAIDQVAETIHRAVTMGAEERRKRMAKLRAYLREENIYRWAGRILSALFKFEFQET